MKTKNTKILFVALLVIFTLSSCFGENVDITKDATHSADTELGTGAITVTVEQVVDDWSVSFTIHTDKTTLADALLEHGLIAGENGDYGLYVKTVNGIYLDYDEDGMYWAFYKGGEYLMTGADSTEISDTEHYEIVASR